MPVTREKFSTKKFAYLKYKRKDSIITDERERKTFDSFLANYEVDENGQPVLYPVLDNDGNPVMTPKLDEDGEEVLGEDGNPIMVPATAMKYFQKYLLDY